MVVLVFVCRYLKVKGYFVISVHKQAKSIAIADGPHVKNTDVTCKRRKYFIVEFNKGNPGKTEAYIATYWVDMK